MRLLTYCDGFNQQADILKPRMKFSKFLIVTRKQSKKHYRLNKPSLNRQLWVAAYHCCRETPEKQNKDAIVCGFIWFQFFSGLG